MNNQDCMALARDMVVSIAVAGTFATAAALASSATAAANPPPAPPADPALLAPPPGPEGPPVPVIGAPLGPGGLSPVAQTGVPPAGPFGLPAISDPNELLLGQRPVPSAPGGPAGTPPNLRAFNNAYLLPQYEEPSAPGEGKVFDVAPGAENADISGLDYVKRVWHLYQGGYLKGSLLGQMPHDQLGAPLPGTAPPPGTNIPPGLAPPAAPAQPVPPA